MSALESLQYLLSRLLAYPVWEMAVELVVIWALAMLTWRFVQGTRAAGAVKGILFVLLGFLLLRLVAPSGSFERLAYLGDRFLGFAAIALVIIFQPELRRAMVRIGEAPLFRAGPADVTPVIDAIVGAVGFLSKNQFGALVAIEGRVGLREVVEGGKILNADVSAELLQSIFWPNNPLHDMGVVVRGSRIVAAGVQFPLADPQEMPDRRLGTRHRAAIGLSRVTDTIVIVVSEETGAISLAERGRLERWLTPETLREELIKRMGQAHRTDAPPEEDDEDDTEAQPLDPGDDDAAKRPGAEEAA
ncbi:MAG: diadenylate cyclase CdaA [Phycisphaerales bacterium]